MFSVDTRGPHDHSFRDVGALTSGRLSSLLTLEITATWRTAAGSDRAACADPAHERREPAVGRASNPRRAWRPPACPHCNGAAAGFSSPRPAAAQAGQRGDDRRRVADLISGQVTGFRARIGDQFLAVAVIQLLRHGELLVGGPSPTLAAGLLQRREIEQARRRLSLFLDRNRDPSNRTGS